MRALAVLLVASVAMAAPAKKKPPSKSKPPPAVVEACAELAACLREVEAAFEGAEFERAQRLVRQAEPLATTPAEQAKVLVLQGTLDAQALGLTEERSAQIRAKYAEAQRLDPTLTVIAIPAFARTEALETLWDAARPVAVVVPPPPERIIQVVNPAPQVPSNRFPVLPTLLGAGAVAGGVTALVLEVVAGRMAGQLVASRPDQTLVKEWSEANTTLTASFAVALGAGALMLGAVVTFILWLGER